MWVKKEIRALWILITHWLTTYFQVTHQFSFYLYVLPIVLFSIIYNTPKFFELEVSIVWVQLIGQPLLIIQITESSLPDDAAALRMAQLLKMAQGSNSSHVAVLDMLVEQLSNVQHQLAIHTIVMRN